MFKLYDSLEREQPISLTVSDAPGTFGWDAPPGLKLLEITLKEADRPGVLLALAEKFQIVQTDKIEAMNWPG